MDNTLLIVERLDTLIGLFKQTGNPLSPSDKKDEPREVVKKDIKVEIDSVSENVKKFFSGLFKFEAPELKKELTKKSSFWITILELLAAAIFGIYEFWKKNIGPLLRDIGAFFIKLEDMFKGLKKWFSETSIGKAIDNFWNRFKHIFSEEGAIGKFFKEGTFLGKIKSSITHLFSEEGLIGKIFSKNGRLAKLLEAIKEFFSLEGEGIFARAVKFLEPYLTKIKMLGKLMSKLLAPLTILFAGLEFKAGYDDAMFSSKDKAIAKMKGAIAFFTNILTLGFINFEDIKKSIDRIIEKYKTGDIIGQFVDVLLLIPESVVKIPIKIMGWIIGFFNKDAGEKVAAWVKNFSLSELLSNFGEKIVEWVSDYIVSPLEDAFKVLKQVFTKDIPNAFSKFFKMIIGFFDKIVNFDYSLILQKIPGYETISKWFSSKPAPTPNQQNKNVGPVAQDYISRPGQPLQQFSSRDTVIGFKEGGPILEQLASNATFTKKFNDLSLRYYSDNIKVLSEIKQIMKDVSEQLQNQKNTNVVVSNKTNNITIPDMTSTTAFRQNFLTQ